MFNYTLQSDDEQNIMWDFGTLNSRNCDVQLLCNRMTIHVIMWDFGQFDRLQRRIVRIWTKHGTNCPQCALNLYLQIF